MPPVGGEMRARELWEMSIRRKEKLRARPQPRVIDRSLFAIRYERERERESAHKGRGGPRCRGQKRPALRQRGERRRRVRDREGSLGPGWERGAGE